MADGVVLRVAAKAALMNSEPALTRARNGDEPDPELSELDAEVQSGDVLAVQLWVSVDAATPDRGEFTVGCHNEDVWVGKPAHVPELAEEVRQIAPKDFRTLSSQLRDRGVDVTANELAEMYVEVTLDETLQRAAAGDGARAGF